MGVTEKTDTIRGTVINCLEAPRLKGVSTQQFTELKTLRDLYEKQIEEKSRHLKEEVLATSFRASIEHEDLEIFVGAGWIEAPSVDKVTERQIKQCIEERCSRSVTEEKLYLVDQAVKGVAMNTSISEAEDLVWSLRREYQNAQRLAGYADIIQNKPHIAINHFHKKLKPTQLYRRVLDIMQWRKVENFHKNKFDRFVREVPVQAEIVQTENRTPPISEGREDKNPRWEHRTNVHVVRTRNVSGAKAAGNKVEKTNNDVRGLNRKRDTFDAPLCLNPICRPQGKRQYISVCDISDKKTKTDLLGKYRCNKKARIDNSKRGDGNIARINDTPTSPHSSAFRASFAKGEIEADLMTDQGADANFISSRIFKEIKQKQSEIHQRELTPEQIYRDVTGTPCLTCKSAAELDVLMQIQHVSMLVLRRITWKITNEYIPCPILRRKGLESLGCDNREMLMAARDRYGEDIDVVERLKEDENNEESDGMIEALFGEAAFHSAGQFEDDGLHEEDMYVDLGDDDIQMVERELQNRVVEAVQNSLSKYEEATLKEIITENKSVFKIHLGSGGPEKVKPMKIVLDPAKKPVKVKVRKYPPDQRKFVDVYFSKLVDMGFLKTCPQAVWQAAPHLVPKDSKSKFRTTIDLRLVNAATKAEQWPMPLIETELSDFIGSNHFASIDLCSSYWQCRLDPDSYDACGIIFPQGTFVSTRVLHGLKNASAYFQSTIPPLFDDIKQSMKAWIDDFTLHSQTEKELLNILENFVTTCKAYNLRISAKKSVFYTKSVKWCGRIIDNQGYRLDSRNMKPYRHWKTPLMQASYASSYTAVDE